MAEENHESKLIPIYHPVGQAARLRVRRWLNIIIVAGIVAAVIIASRYV